MKTKIIVFDLYNTLVEITKNTHHFLKLYKLSSNGFGIDLLDYTQLIMKNDITHVLNTLPHEFKAIFEANKNALADEIASVQLYEETISMLEELKKDYPIYLISNLASPYKEAVYHLGIDHYFTKMIFSCDSGYLKPQKEIFRLVEEDVKSGAEIIMIGDSQKSDIEGAKQMGWSYLKVSRKAKELKELEIRSLLEIKPKLNAV